MEREIGSSITWIRFLQIFFPGWLLVAFWLLYFLRIKDLFVFRPETYYLDLLSFISAKFSLIFAVIFGLGLLFGILLTGIENPTKDFMGCLLMRFFHSVLLSSKYIPIDYLKINHLGDMLNSYKKDLITKICKKPKFPIKPRHKKCMHKIESMLWMELSANERTLLEARNNQCTMFLNISFISFIFFLFEFFFILNTKYHWNIWDMLTDRLNPWVWPTLVLFFYMLGNLAANLYSFARSYREKRKVEVFPERVDFELKFALLIYVISLLTCVVFLNLFATEVFPHIVFLDFLDFPLLIFFFTIHVTAYWSGCKHYDRFREYFNITFDKRLYQFKNKKFIETHFNCGKCLQNEKQNNAETFHRNIFLAKVM